MAKTKPQPQTTAKQPSLQPAKPQPLFDASNNIYFGQKLGKVHLWALIMACFAFGLYFNTVFNGFAVDDTNVILEHPYTKQGIKAVGKILTSDSYPPAKDVIAVNHNPYYRPLSIVTLAIEHSLWGEKQENGEYKLNPHLSHLMNVLYFAATIFILYLWLAQYLFPDKQILAVIVTLLFAVHPIHTEAVANLKGRDEVLSFLFLVGMMYGIFRYLNSEQKTVTGFVVPLVCYFLALLSKENGVVFIVLAPLTVFVFHQKENDFNLKPLRQLAIVLGLVFLVYILLRAYSIGLKPHSESVPDILNNFYYGKGFNEKYGTIVSVLGMYIKLLIWPHPLSWDYRYATIPFTDFSDPMVIFWFLVHAGALGFALWKIKTKSVAAYAILFYLASIFLVSNIVINIGGFVGERFLYQGSLGFVLLVALGLVWLHDKLPKPYGVVICWGMVAVILGLGSYKTITRNMDWKDNFTLFTKDLEAVPNSCMALYSAGKVTVVKAQDAYKLKTKADSIAAYNYVKQAIGYYERSTAIFNKHADVFNDFGNAWNLIGELDKADSLWAISRKLNPLHPKAAGYKAYLADMYRIRAEKALQSDDKLKAIPALDKYTRYRPNDMAMWGKYVELLMNNGKVEQAIEVMSAAADSNRKEPQYTFNLALACLANGQYERGLTAIKRTLALNPNFPNAQNVANELQLKYNATLNNKRN